jgi:hypothetical protein
MLFFELFPAFMTLVCLILFCVLLVMNRSPRGGPDE